MPWKIAGPCSVPGCPNRAVKAGRCAEHQRAEQRRYNAQRGTVTQQGYGQAWRKIRDKFIREHPWCEWPEGCDQRATDVDHRIPRRQGGSDDETNLTALCHRHHSEKTAREDGRWGK